MTEDGNNLRSKNAVLNGNQTVSLVTEIEGKSLHLKKTFILIHILLSHFIESISEQIEHSSVKSLRGTSQTIMSRKGKAKEENGSLTCK